MDEQEISHVNTLGMLNVADTAGSSFRETGAGILVSESSREGPMVSRSQPALPRSDKIEKRKNIGQQIVIKTEGNEKKTKCKVQKKTEVTTHQLNNLGGVAERGTHDHGGIPVALVVVVDAGHALDSCCEVRR